MSVSAINRTTEEVREFCSNEDLISYVVMLGPRRPGVMLFGILLEYVFFPPGTKKNEEFHMHFVNWEEMMFGIISIPKKKKIYAVEVAKISGTRIANGVPTLISEGQVAMFPVDSNNVFTIENESGSPVYKGSYARDVMISIEDQIIKDIEGKDVAAWFEENKDEMGGG